jgi:hypothetical protein
MAFFPLYPLVVSILAASSGMPLAWSGFLFSVTCFVASGVLLYAWIREDYGPRVAVRSVVAMCVFPMAFFFAAFYAEPLFLVCSIASLWLARRRHFAASGLAIALAGATRPQAFLLCVPLIVEFWLDRRSWRGTSGSFLAGLLLAPVGAVAYLAWLHAQTGAQGGLTDLYFQITRDEWKTSLTWPWVTMWDGLSAAVAGAGVSPDLFSRALSVHDLLYALLALGLTIWSFGRLRLSTWSYLAVGTLSLYVTHGPFGYAFWSIGRRVATLVPIYVALAMLAVRLPVRAQWALGATAAIALGVTAGWFSIGRWIA